MNVGKANVMVWKGLINVPWEWLSCALNTVLPYNGSRVYAVLASYTSRVALVV